ncbi:MAG: hypothetical protein OEV59_03105 [Deltaproteobacteria bacterium]|nr:hypothetical protein [Deltaproteobacteria bacterium]
MRRLVSIVTLSAFLFAVFMPSVAAAMADSEECSHGAMCPHRHGKKAAPDNAANEHQGHEGHGAPSMCHSTHASPDNQEDNHDDHGAGHEGSDSGSAKIPANTCVIKCCDHTAAAVAGAVENSITSASCNVALVNGSAAFSQSSLSIHKNHFTEPSERPPAA